MDGKDEQDDKYKNIIEQDDKYKNIIDVYKNALDDLVNVNSLFTIAVFIGLSLATPGQHSLEYYRRPECDPEPTQAKRLVLMEVLSFSFFLLSSLVAKSVKVNLQIFQGKNFDKKFRLNKKKWLLLLLSTIASFAGCFFLMMSMVYVVQIRLGKMSCKSVYTETAIASMIAIVSIAMLIYVSLVSAALYKARKGRAEEATGKKEITP